MKLSRISFFPPFFLESMVHTMGGTMKRVMKEQQIISTESTKTKNRRNRTIQTKQSNK